MRPRWPAVRYLKKGAFKNTDFTALLVRQDVPGNGVRVIVVVDRK